MLTVFEAPGYLIPVKGALVKMASTGKSRLYPIEWRDLQTNRLPIALIGIVCGTTDNPTGWSTHGFNDTPVLCWDLDDCSVPEAVERVEQAFPGVQYHARQSVGGSGCHVYVLCSRNIPTASEWSRLVRKYAKSLGSDPDCGGRLRFELLDREFQSGGEAPLELPEYDAATDVDTSNRAYLDMEFGAEAENWTAFAVNTINATCPRVEAATGPEGIIYLATTLERTAWGFYASPLFAKRLFKQGKQTAADDDPEKGGLAWDSEVITSRFPEPERSRLKEIIGTIRRWSGADMERGLENLETCDPLFLSMMMSRLLAQAGPEATRKLISNAPADSGVRNFETTSATARKGT